MGGGAAVEEVAVAAEAEPAGVGTPGGGAAVAASERQGGQRDERYEAAGRHVPEPRRTPPSTADIFLSNHAIFTPTKPRNASTFFGGFSQLVPSPGTNVSTTWYMPGSNFAIVSASCKYGSGVGSFRMAS